MATPSRAAPPTRGQDKYPPARVLVKLRPSLGLRAVDSKANLRPLFHGPRAEADAFRIGGESQWFIADLPEGGATPWDLAHARIADQLGVTESDVVFAEPDLVHDIYPDPQGPVPRGPFAVAEDCAIRPQNDNGGQAMGPTQEGWHLDPGFSQLAKAREAVSFTDPRTRIAHLDTGYSRKHVSRPEHILSHLERSFVPGDADPSSAQDPDRDVFLIDNSGHGTGTLGILAGGKVPAWNGRYLGGAPDADVVPLRIADRVVLLHTSAFAAALAWATEHRCDVVTMSMGGLPSRAWRETVDAAYLAGVCVVSAAGNNFNGLPTRHLVYPARYGRVLAVCGVMADGRPYAGLEGIRTMEGNYGPNSKMGAAMSAYSPNIPWARYGCEDAVRLDGGGTSAATPQVAAAAALWIEKYKHDLPRDWRRVEAVRHALFESSKSRNQKKKLGRGIVQAFKALSVAPVLGLPQTKSDRDSFALFRVLTGLGLTEAPLREEMFNLELSQRWLIDPALQELVPDPDVADPGMDPAKLRKVMEIVIEDPGTSRALREHLVERYALVTGSRPRRTRKTRDVVPEKLAACEPTPALTNPAHRRLRVYAGDPSLSAQLATAGTNEVVLEVPWEDLKPGPVGEYLDVDDVDATGRRNDRVKLDDPRLLARDGWAPSAGNAQFHQQMVYAVAMQTIGHFQRALGRQVLWRPRRNPENPHDDSGFVQRLKIRPHALRQSNAFYSPDEVALKFGYFEATPETPDIQVPGSRVYTCLSHDIVAHETTHAILDGMHRRFNEPTNPDVLALHEGFADIVALMQHFTLQEVLEREIGRTRGDLETESHLGSLAVQFGYSIGRRGALREAIGRVQDGVWKRLEPDPAELQKRLSPHARGAILVAAVFDAFLAIYKSRTADLLRIYTGGTGVLPAGAIHPDLVNRLAAEAAKAAKHVLTMCIRALDYMPPVDVTFFEYLRALITADYDLVRDDRHNYRVAFVEAFRRRGIFPEDLETATRGTPRTLSVETLRWQGIDRLKLRKKVRAQIEKRNAEMIEELKRYADRCTYFRTREQLFRETHAQRRILHDQLAESFKLAPEYAATLGVDAKQGFEVHELRSVFRTDPDGRPVPQAILALTQSTRVQGDEKTGTPAFTFRGGSTLVVDLKGPAVKYRIVKNVKSRHRLKRTGNFFREMTADPLRSFFFGPDNREPFAALHGLADEGA